MGITAATFLCWKYSTMILRLRLLITVFSFGLFSLTQAQTLKLSGKIVNEKNEPLPGVSVKIVGASGGVSTDIEGRFSLSLSAGKKYELEFSAVGYDTKNITDVEVIKGQVNELNIFIVENRRKRRCTSKPKAKSGLKP
jgi:hypothetical protein